MSLPSGSLFGLNLKADSGARDGTGKRIPERETGRQNRFHDVATGRKRFLIS
jgi:hypothetical protein